MPFKKHLNKNAIPQKALCLEQLVEMIIQFSLQYGFII